MSIWKKIFFKKGALQPQKLLLSSSSHIPHPPKKRKYDVKQKKEPDKEKESTRKNIEEPIEKGCQHDF